MGCVRQSASSASSAPSSALFVEGSQADGWADDCSGASPSPRDRWRDRSNAPDCLTSTVACAEVCRSVRSVWAGTDERARFVSAFSRTDWTDGQILVFSPVVSCVCADGASVSGSVRTFDGRTDATDRRGVPRLLCLFLLGGLAGGRSSGGET